jgi:DNA-binding transcriptional LysR family regulator
VEIPHNRSSYDIDYRSFSVFANIKSTSSLATFFAIAHDDVKFWCTANTDKDTLIYDPSLFQSQKLFSKLEDHYFSRKIESANLEAIAALAEAGIGVAILPTRVAKRFPKLIIFRDGLSHDGHICLIYRADRHMSAAGRLVAEKIRAARF